MIQPKISIVLPIYNVEKYLVRCMDSILNQTLSEIEIIMVDDGSPDNCPIMCDDYAAKDKRIRVIHKKNEGLGYARNSGMEVATGEYIAFIDADDYISFEMMKQLYDIAKKNQLQAVYCGIKRIDHVGNVIEDNIGVSSYVEYSGYGECRKIGLEMISSLDSKKLAGKFMMSVCHSIYDLKFLRDNYIKFYSERDFISEDMIFDIDFFTNTTKVGFVPYSYYYYCYNSTSLSHTFKTNEYERIKKHYFEVLIKLSKAGFSSRELNVAHKYMIIKTRAYIYNLYGTDLDCNVKNKLISDVVEDDLLWDQIKKTNVIRILPLKLKLFYIALLLKQEWILKMITLYANRYSRK